MTKKSPRVHRETLRPELASALLNVPYGQVEGHPTTITSRLMDAIDALHQVIDRANESLAKNPLMEVIAEHAARLTGRRGSPTVIVDPNGEVMLEIHYLAAGEAPPTPTRKTVLKSRLPNIDVLRREAESLGIDWKPFGKAKTKLIEAMETHKASKSVVVPVAKPKAKPKPTPAPALKLAPKPKMTRTAPSLTPPQQVKLDGQSIIPVDDDEDGLDELFGGKKKAVRNQVNAPSAAPAMDVQVHVAPKDQGLPKSRGKRKPTPRRGTSTDTVKPTKKLSRSLADIADNADTDIDIEAILAKPASPPPKDD